MVRRSTARPCHPPESPPPSYSYSATWTMFAGEVMLLGNQEPLAGVSLVPIQVLTTRFRLGQSLL